MDIAAMLEWFKEERARLEDEHTAYFVGPDWSKRIRTLEESARFWQERTDMEDTERTIAYLERRVAAQQPGGAG